jgi:hypothetical protein
VAGRTLHSGRSAEAYVVPSAILHGIDPQRVVDIEYDRYTGEILCIALPDDLLAAVPAMSKAEWRQFLQAELRRIAVEDSGSPT